MRALVIALLVACGGHAHEAPVAEPAAVSFTRWTATHEFFVEYPPFVVGQASTFAARSFSVANRGSLSRCDSPSTSHRRTACAS